MKNIITKNKKGFTIVEMMIAIALFLVVVIYGMQSLLSANFAHKKSQDMRSILDGLTFALEDMSKNIRVGSNYHCIETESDFYDISDNKPKSCKDGFGISFESATGDPDDGTDQWVYFISGDPGKLKLWKGTSAPYSGESNAIQLTSDDVMIKNISGFSVLGAENPLLGNKQQPFVIIRLSGEVKYRDTVTPFEVETAVSQRLIDVPPQANIIIIPSDPSINPQDQLSRDQAGLLEATVQDMQVIVGP